MARALFTALLVLAIAVSASAGPRPAGPVRIAIGAMISPKETFIEYRRLVDYIGEKIGRKAEILQRGSYEGIDSLLREGAVDLAFICSGPYVDDKASFDVDLLAVPVVRGKTTYRSYIIVRKAAPYYTLSDLKGKSFAFTDPESNTGHDVPLYMVSKMGEDPDRFFSKTIYTRAHDNSVEAVSSGLVEGAGVDSVIYEYMLAKNYPAVKDTRVLVASDPYGMPPVVTPKGVDPKLRAAARKALLDMHRDPAGRKILDSLLIDRFVAARDSDYDGVRAVEEFVNKRKGR